MEEEDANPNDWRSRQTLRRPQQFDVTRQPPLHLDLRHAPLDEAAAVGPHCFVASHLHLYAFESSRDDAELPRGGDGGRGSGSIEAGASGGGRPGLGMCLGLLLLQELPELPPFTVYEAAREEGQPPLRYQCRLRYCRTLDLSMGEPLLPRFPSARFLMPHGRLQHVHRTSTQQVSVPYAWKRGAGWWAPCVDRRYVGISASVCTGAHLPVESKDSRALSSWEASTVDSSVVAVLCCFRPLSGSLPYTLLEHTYTPVHL